MKPHFPFRPDPAVVLVALLVAVNVFSVVGLAGARRDARIAIDEGLVLETRADARAFEARLAREHAQLDFLAASPSLASLSAAARLDPVARRWARLDLEASLLLYLESSPAVVCLRVRGGPEADALRAVAHRLDGVPILAAPDAPLSLDPGLLRASWSLDGTEADGGVTGPTGSTPDSGGGMLDAWVDPGPLVADVGAHLRLHPSAPALGTVAGPLEPVSSPAWSPPLDGFLERTESDTRVLGAVERLAGLYRNNLLLNVALLPVTLLLGALTVRRVRRLARLESERRQQERVRALELQVEHSERLASLGRFAAGMAHEINNPLEGMANYLELLRDDLESGRADDARQWLPRLDEGIDRVAGTVRQVLHFAEPGSTMDEPVDLASVLRRTLDFLGGHPDCRSHDLHLDCPEELWLEGDAVGLGQLVSNLVLNACQAPSGSEVRVIALGDGSTNTRTDAGESTAATEENGDDGDEEIRLTVLDHGPGFAPEIRDRVFEPFQSTRGSNGLGLAVCHSIVTRHGGRIEIRDRQPGPGAEVRVSLPRRGPSGLRAQEET